MEVRQNLSLPDGYWARQIDGVWYLFDHRNVMLAGPADAATVEEHAWRDVWRRIDEDIEDEIAAFRAGTRPLHELRRMRQYFRMLDAVANVHSEPETRPSRTEPGHRRVFAAAAAAAAAAVVIVAMSIARGPGGPTRLRWPDQHAAQLSATLPKSLAAALENRSTTEVVQSTAATHVPVTTPPAHQAALRRPIAKYAVSVGSFTIPAIADRMMHLVRRKGYIVDVVPRGAVSQVVTPPFQTRTQAEYVVHGLEEIGLPAQLTAWRMP